MGKKTVTSNMGERRKGRFAEMYDRVALLGERKFVEFLSELVR